MKYANCVVLACGLLCSASKLSAQSVGRPTPSALAGCYALTLGPWQQQPYPGPAFSQILPPVIRLDTALAARVAGWRQLGPTMPYFTQSRGEIGPAWRVSATDSVEAFWSTGFVGTQLTLAVRVACPVELR